MLVVTAYTADYTADAERLVKSATQHGVKVSTELLEDRGSWLANCSQKAEFLAQRLEEFDDDLLWLDADCFIKDKQGIEGIKKQANASNADLSCQVVPLAAMKPPGQAVKKRYWAWMFGGMWNSGVLFLRNKNNVKALVHEWADLQSTFPDEWDQITLLQVAQEWDVTFNPLNLEYHAGGKFIGHNSGYHRIHAKDKPARWLLLGSAPGVESWWERYGSRYEDAQFYLAGLNNAFRIKGFGDRAQHVWFRPNDFKDNALREGRPLPSTDWHVYENPDGWQKSPYWTDRARLSFVDTCYHLLNMYHRVGKTIELHVAGCDFIYDEGNKTHFYPGGHKDPLRYGDDVLDTVLDELLAAFNAQGSRIINASDQRRTRLPFDRHILGRF